MSAINDGGPAFPQGLYATETEMAGGRYDGTYVSRYEAIDGGLTVRDYFAAKAMAGSLGGVPGPHLVPHTLARESYAMADAMLRAREQS